MTRYKITAPNALYDGKVGDLQFSQGVYEGEVPDAILNYCRATGYAVEEISAAREPKAKPVDADSGSDGSGDVAAPAAKKAPAKKAAAKKAPAKPAADDKNGAST